jgi:PKD repeat protein
LAADVTSGPAPLTVQFDASGSSDPDAGDTLTYVWDFGDEAAPVETASATATHQYAAAGTYTASLTVRDNHGATSAPATIRIEVGPSLVAPANIVLPTIAGNLRVANVLFANAGTWSGSAPIDLMYQWLRCDSDGVECVPIFGATEQAYTLTPPDFGETLRVVVTATNGAGSTIAASLATPRIKHECSGDPCISS